VKGEKRRGGEMVGGRNGDGKGKRQRGREGCPQTDTAKFQILRNTCCPG